jgi:hypothetical protein
MLLPLEMLSEVLSFPDWEHFHSISVSTLLLQYILVIELVYTRYGAIYIVRLRQTYCTHCTVRCSKSEIYDSIRCMIGRMVSTDVVF